VTAEPRAAEIDDPGDPFGLDTFTLGELADLEGIVGVPFDRLSEAPSRARFMAGMLYIRRRRSDPTTTLASVMGATMAEIVDELGVGGGAPSPTLPVGSET
jgi:hypothetical protein